MPTTRWLASVALVACFHSASMGAEESPHHAVFMKCAKACMDCQWQCDTCFNHCATLLAAGDKAHAVTMRNCVDCGDCCKLAATLIGRESKFSAGACEFCAKCCDECAAACEKFPDDKHMAACAKSCKDCAKECREMVKHSK